MKKICFCLLVCFTVIITSVSLAYASDEMVEVPDVKVVIDGKLTTYTDIPLSVNGRIMLPLRAVLVNLGIPDDDQHIIWNSEEKSVTIYKDSKKIYLKQGKDIAYINDVPVTLDAAPVEYSKNWRTYIPVRFIAQSLGKKVEWEGSTKTVLISDESQFNKVKEIIEKACETMNELEKSKINQNIVFTKSIENMNVGFEVDAQYLLDYIKKAVYCNGNVERILMPNLSNSTSYELYAAENASYQKDTLSGTWSGTILSEEEFNKNLNVYSFLENKNSIFAGMHVDESTSPDEIILEGKVFINELAAYAIKSALLSSYTINDTELKITLEKKSLYIKNVLFRAAGDGIHLNQKIQWDLKYNYQSSDFNGSFEVVMPKDLESQILQVRAKAEFNEGVKLFEDGKYKEAVDCFDKVIKIQPNNIDAYYYKGITLRFSGKYLEALQCYEKVTELDPSNMRAYSHKADLYFFVGNFKESVKNYDIVINNNPEDIGAYEGKVASLYMMRKYDEVVQCNDKILEINPKNPQAFYINANVYALMNKVDNAIANLKKAIELDATCKERAKKDKDFDNIRNKSEFIQLISD